VAGGSLPETCPFSLPLILSLSKDVPERTELSFDKLRMRARLFEGCGSGYPGRVRFGLSRENGALPLSSGFAVLRRIII